MRLSHVVIPYEVIYVALEFQDHSFVEKKSVCSPTYFCRIDRMLIWRYMHNSWGESLSDRRYCKARGVLPLIVSTALTPKIGHGLDIHLLHNMS